MDAFAKIVTYTYEGLPPRRKAEKSAGAQTTAVNADASQRIAQVPASQAIVNMTYDPLGWAITLTYDAASFPPKEQKG